VTCVVDSSVAVKWYLAEPDHEAALRLLMRGDRLVAPDLILVELANVAWKRVQRGEIDAMFGRGMVAELIAGDVELLRSADLADAALEIAIDLGHPVYDCFYLACAQAQGLAVVTADRRLAARVAGTPYGRLVQPLA